MDVHVLRLSHNLQIIWRVISFISVFVVNDFTLPQASAKHLFGDNPVDMPMVELHIAVSSPSEAPSITNLVGVECAVATIAAQCGTEQRSLLTVWPDPERRATHHAVESVSDACAHSSSFGFRTWRIGIVLRSRRNP